MSDRPEGSKQPEQKSQQGGWQTPENPVSGKAASEPAPQRPMPAAGDPAQPGLWKASQPEKENLPDGAALSTEIDYSNYVPGVGFVPKAGGSGGGESMDEPVPSAAASAPVAPAAAQPAVITETGTQPSPTSAVSAVPVPAQTPSQPVPAAPASPVAAPVGPIIREPSPGVIHTTAIPVSPGTGSLAARAFAAPAPTAAQPVPQATLVQPAPPVATTGGTSGVTGEQLAAQLASQPANQALVQKFIEVEKAVQTLRRRYTAGSLTRDQLQAELRKLMILDEAGLWWMIGLETDKWYKYDGRDWVLSTPPGYTPAPSATKGGVVPAATSAASAGISGLSAVGTVAPAARPDIPLDEYGMPLPQRVPIEDPGATIVGRAAPKLDNTLRSPSEPTALNARLQAEAAARGVAPYTSGATVANPAVAAKPLSQQLTQPSAAVAAGVIPAGGVSIPAPGASGVSTVVSEKPKSIQPDYGPRPTNWANDRTRRVGCIIQIALASVFVALALSLLGTIGAVLYYNNTINEYSAKIANLPNEFGAQTQSVKFFDATGRQIYQLNDPNTGSRTVVPLSEISPNLIHAVVATENERFYTDPGFDVIAILRAVLQNVRTSGQGGGASTITQQLTRRMVLDPGAANDRSAGRKITEILVASEVARKYTKSEILQFYLNTVYFGNLAYGVEAAARVYFNKSPRDLTIVESAFLAGLVQSPAGYDPSLDKGVSAIERTKAVLGLMAQLGCVQMEHPPENVQPYCIQKADIEAGQTQVGLSLLTAQMSSFKPASNPITYPHFVNYVKAILEEQYGQDALYSGGFSVYTTIDPRIQDAADLAAKNQIARLAGQNVSNASVVVVNPTTGAVLAMVGSVDFNNANIDGQVNVAISPRQPGSSIKPFVYLAAFEQAPDGRYWYPGTSLWDIPTNFNGYQPVNYNRRFVGPTTVREALAQSINIPAVKALEYVGIERFKALSDRVGIRFPLTQPEQSGLTAALGGVEVRLLDMVRAYSVLANNGVQIPTYTIQRITRRNAAGTEEAVFEWVRPEARQVVEAPFAWMVTNILADNGARAAAFGANSALNIPGTAVKTGTTNDYKDNWTVGYTPQFVVGVWVGNTRGEPMGQGVSGITGAAPIWNQVMLASLQTLQGQPQGFPVPPQVQQTTICGDFGTQNFQGCRNPRNEFFHQQLPPPSGDAVLSVIPVDTFSGLRANTFCPQFVEQRVYLNLPDSRVYTWLNTTQQGQAWFAASGWEQAYSVKLPLEQPPTGECTQNQPQPVISISQPANQQTVSGLVQVFGTVFIPEFNRYQLEVGIGFQPTEWRIVDGPIASLPGQNTFLGRWDTSQFPPGDYTLRLLAIDNSGRFADVKVPVRVIIAQITPTLGPLPTDPGSIIVTPPPAETPFFPIPNATETPIIIDSNPIIDPPTPTPIDLFPPTTAP